MSDDIEYFSTNNNPFRTEGMKPIGFVHVDRAPLTILTYMGKRKEIKEGQMVFYWHRLGEPTYFQL